MRGIAWQQYIGPIKQERDFILSLLHSLKEELLNTRKEMMASISGMQSGLVTFQDVQANYGRDVEELFEQHEREQKLAEQYGVKTAFQPFGMKMPVEADIQGGEGGEDG